MDDDLQSLGVALLAGAGIQASVLAMRPCNAGGNNRTYRMETSAGPFAIKQYFRHEGDVRDRLASEYAFLRYAAKVAPSMVPAPLGIDEANGLALYEFIEGSAHAAGEISWTQVEAAARLFRALNEAEARRDATDLPSASEACFAIGDHLRLISSRLERLRAIDSSGKEGKGAQILIERIHRRWLNLVEEVSVACRSGGIDIGEPLDQTQRCISHSDFGFHNALKTEDGSIRFLDFEYAGWDDPAKMTGDFFAQIAVPVPADLFSRFVEETVDVLPRPTQLYVRARLLRPVYQIKWCCIALNVFLPVNMARRKFADPQLDEIGLKQSQLVKAENLFQSIRNLEHGLH
jgi:Ser/Thr protein kinase RdoA (MazF antagonist)